MSTEPQKPRLAVNTGPFKKVLILGHATVEERDTEAGKVGCTLEDADYSDIYRSTLPELHDKAAPVVKALSGIDRGVNKEQTEKNQKRANDAAAAAKPPKTAATVKDVPESFVDYAERVKSSVSEEIWKTIDEKFRELALATPVDASPSKRTGAASKANLEKAEEILNRTPDNIEAAVTKMLALVPDFELVREDGVPEKTSLARLVGAWTAASMAGV